VFSEEGTEGLSIRRLAEEIDYSPAAIYKYFESKDDLLEALKAAFFDRLLAGVDPEQLRAMPFQTRARLVLTRYIETATADPNHYIAAFSGIVKPSDEAAPLNWETFTCLSKGRAFHMLASLVADGQAEGVVDPGLDVVTTAKSLWASLHGLAQLLNHLPHLPGMRPETAVTPGASHEGQTALVEAHIELLLRSFVSPGASTSPATAQTQDILP
jgi:AcrR family transcriptional regulator